MTGEYKHEHQWQIVGYDHGDTYVAPCFIYWCDVCGAVSTATLHTSSSTAANVKWGDRPTDQEIERRRAYFNQKWRSLFNPDVPDPDLQLSK